MEWKPAAENGKNMRLAAGMITLGRREGAECSNAHAWWLCATISLCQARTTSKTTQGEYKNGKCCMLLVHH